MDEEQGGYTLCPVASLTTYLCKIPADAEVLHLHPGQVVSPSDSKLLETLTRKQKALE